jgi:hypothetical protein
MTAMGDKVDKRNMIGGTAPVVLRAQSDGYVELKTPTELKQWEDDVKKFYGVSISSAAVRPCETCSGGCSDDCGVLA